MNSIEMNDTFVTSIITGKSDILKLRHQETLEDGTLRVVLEDQTNEFFEGIVAKNNGNYIIVGDSEWDRVYPVIDTKTKQIVKIKRSEDNPPG